MSTPLPIQIRPVAAGDIPALIVVIDSTGLFPGEMLPDMVKPFLDDPATPDEWFAVTLADEPVAVAYIVPERLTLGTYNLLLIAVDASRQGTGIGEKLLTSIESHLAGRDGRLLLVETSGLPDYARTRNFYLKNGYEQEARIREFYAPGEDKIVFRKEL